MIINNAGLMPHSPLERGKVQSHQGELRRPPVFERIVRIGTLDPVHQQRMRRHIRVAHPVGQDGVDALQKLVLLSVFLRPDEEITADIRKVLDEILIAAPGDADVSVRDGVVTLTA